MLQPHREIIMQLMKNPTAIKLLSIAAIMTTASFAPTVSFAASQDECKIWLCLPGGFPSGCGGAESAMKGRVKKGKSPLPAFSSCTADGSSQGMSSSSGRAAEIRNGQSWVRDTTCRRHRTDYFPSGCTGSGWFAEVLIDGTKQGDTFFFMP